MTLIHSFKSACPHCHHQWEAYKQVSGNNFGLSREMDREQVKNWILQWEREPSPYRCPSCNSFDIEYREDYSTRDGDPLNDGKNIRPGSSEIGEVFSNRLVAQKYYWSQRKDIEPEFRDAKLRELEATIELVRKECHQIDNAEPKERDAKLREIDKQIDLLRDVSIRIDKDRRNEKKKGFGFEINNPIAARSIKNCYDYLDRLTTSEDEPITYQRKGSVVSPHLKIQANGEEAKASIDIYDIVAGNGQKICQLFICPYLRKTSSSAPEGFNLREASPLNEEDLLEIKSFEERVARMTKEGKLSDPNPLFVTVH